MMAYRFQFVGTKHEISWLDDDDGRAIMLNSDNDYGSWHDD